MGFLDRFRKQSDELEFDPLKDLVLAKLKVGYLLDYDLRTWQVTDYARYRFNDGRESEEWELTAERDKRYLERAQGDGDGEIWTLSKNIPIGAIKVAPEGRKRNEVAPEGRKRNEVAPEGRKRDDLDVRQHILEHDDPPAEVAYKGTVYYLEGSNGGYLLPGGAAAPHRELIQWELLDEDEERFLSIMQWSEAEVTAVSGIFVEDYQFTDILPGELE